MRPALMRWTWRTSSPSSVGNRRCFPRRRAPAKRRPSSAESGGSNVFSVAMCAGPAFATGARATGSSSAWRAASTSGNSGIAFLLVDAINVAATRGDIVESRHRVHAVVVRDGEAAESWGDPDLVAYVRSSLKPVQALPLVQYGLPTEELAIACASHEALPDQLVAVRALLERAGASTDDLECGAEHGSRLRHNCSGKHAGFLFLCRRTRVGHRGLPAGGAPAAAGDPGPRLRGWWAASRPTAVDGCGVPTFALTLTEMAAMFAGFARDEPEGVATLTAAMTAHPELVGGPHSVDTLVMRALPGAVAKRGAEGLLCAGLPDGSGLALKVEDGAHRATYAAAGAVLRIPELADRPVHSSRGDLVGRITTEPVKSRLPLFHRRCRIPGRCACRAGERQTSPALFSFQPQTLHR